MAEYSKFNIVYRMQKWMDSVPGQTFLNYAYSWGASIVILGALFKLTHLPGANIMLFVGMGIVGDTFQRKACEFGVNVKAVRKYDCFFGGVCGCTGELELLI